MWHIESSSLITSLSSPIPLCLWGGKESESLISGMDANPEYEEGGAPQIKQITSKEFAAKHR